jgi:hypothetical protein
MSHRGIASVRRLGREATVLQLRPSEIQSEMWKINHQAVIGWPGGISRNSRLMVGTSGIRRKYVTRRHAGSARIANRPVRHGRSRLSSKFDASNDRFAAIPATVANPRNRTPRNSRLGSNPVNTVDETEETFPRFARRLDKVPRR